MLHTGLLLRTAVAAALLLTAGCSDSSGEETVSPEDEAAWSTSKDPVEAGGLIWATDGVVHLADGSKVDVGGPITTYVVAGDGVYFTPAESDQDGTEHGNMSTAPLHFADRDGDVTDTGLTVYVESLGSSVDGRYLGLVDATSGPEDRFSDQPQATAVVIDLSSGKRVVDTREGMGDPDEEDLAHDYPEVFLSVRFPDSNSAFVEGLDDFLYALPSGEGDAVDAIDSGVHDPLDRTSPDGTWAIDDRGQVEVLLSADGDRVRPRTGTPRWDLGWWLDDRTVVGIEISGPGSSIELGPDDSAALVTCQVPSGTCQTIEGTEDMLLRFPVGDSPSDAVDLRGGTTP